MRRRKRNIMLRTKAQSDKREGADFAVRIKFLIRLKTLQRVNGIVVPLAVHFTLEVTSISKCFLDFQIAAGVRMQLIGGCCRASSAAARMRTSGGFLRRCGG